MKKFFTIISVLFHPLFISVWMLLFLYFVDPVISIFFNGKRGFQIITILLLLMVIIPIILMKVMRDYGIISSFEMPEKEERFSAYAVVAVLYLINYQMLFQMGAPRILRLAVFGVLIVLIMLSIINRFYKISAHMAALGGMIGFITYSSLMDSSMMFYLILSVLIAGFVASARLYLLAHNNFQVVSGLILGGAIMFAVFFLNWLPTF